VERRRTAREPEPVSSGTVHTLGAGGPLVSVCLPVKDGGARLGRLLDGLLAQEADCRLEIVAVDSGSSDDSVQALVERGARVVRIPSEDFNHGSTRNRLARMADGDPLVYLSQRAEPGHPGWLAALLRALDEDATLAAVCSRVLPPPGFSVLAERDAVRDLSASPVPDVRGLEPGEAERLSPHELRVRINFHTVSAAVRRDVLRETPFREVRAIGEDVLWALEVMKGGRRIRHEPTSMVWHGDDAPLFEVLGRNVDDGLANAEIVGRRMPRADVLPQIEGMVRDDWAFLEGLGLDPERLERERIASVLRRAAQTIGQYVGCNPSELPPGLLGALSQVERRVVARDGSSG
jgi:rhamnosyltransferase